MDYPFVQPPSSAGFQSVELHEVAKRVYGRIITTMEKLYDSNPHLLPLPQQPPYLYTVREVSRLLAVGRRVVRRLVRNGELVGFRFPCERSPIHITQESLEKLVARWAGQASDSTPVPRR